MDLLRSLSNFLFYFFEYSMVQGLVSGIVSTFIGVVLGVPVALWINRRVEDATEREKRSKIVYSLLSELRDNKILLSGWPEIKPGSGVSLSEDVVIKVCLALSDEVWNSFSEGGELEWIKNPNFLNALARAYRMIKHIKLLANMYVNGSTDDHDVQPELITYVNDAKTYISNLLLIPNPYASKKD